MSEAKGEMKDHVNEETPLHIHESKEDEEDLRYGWGSIRPQWLQVLNNPKFFVSALAFFAFIQGNA